ncbi:MAG TPA: shikimate dehydrogenase [Steroidobacteraceae bacterium]|nr:shikimate dehydrogenase [Steroidobacteraceae bacterium]
MSNRDRYAVIGHPVAHSRSPFIHRRFAAQTHQVLEYGLIDARPEEFVAAVQGFFAAGGRGLNVTVPHKEAAFRLATKLTPRAQRARAVNTLAPAENDGLLGDNTDGAGLVRDLLNNQGITIAGRRLLLLGAGGAARGALAPLLGLRPSELVVVNRDRQRAAELVAQFGDLGPLRASDYAALGGESFDIVINATAASLAGELPPLPPGIVTARSICYDMAYAREDTPFVRWAHERGVARAPMGLGMLVEQAAESFHLWRGVRPDTASVLVELTAGLRGGSATGRSEETGNDEVSQPGKAEPDAVE